MFQTYFPGGLSANGSKVFRCRLSGVHRLRVGVLVLLSVVFSGQVFAGQVVQEGTLHPVEDLLVVGSRAQGRAMGESLVPVQLFDGDEFSRQGGSNLADLLRTLAPSFNVNTQPISDAGTIVRPSNLRGLAPDHTLLMVNGKRRHRGSVIYWLSQSPSSGAQGPDLDMIPAIAVKRVELLGDGASAQYGSDAIAGVINVVLKDAPSGGDIEVKYGGYYAGDGDQYTLAANLGLPLGVDGFANLSLEYGASDPTVRSVQRDDAAALVALGNPYIADPVQIWGSPDVEDNLKFWGNFALPLGPAAQLYTQTNYAGKTVDGGFNYRHPYTRSGVFSNDAGATLLVADVQDALDGTLDNSSNCPTVSVNNFVVDQQALDEVLANPDCFWFGEMFPGGFLPRFGGDLEDFSWLSGVRGKINGKLRWDVSAGFGRNQIDYFIYDTVNGSLGPQSPSAFDPGYNRQSEWVFNVDVSYPLGGWGHIAGGLEWREEEFVIGLGDPASYVLGPYAAQGFSSGSNGFPGFSEIAAGRWRQEYLAGYLDTEWMLSPAWDLGIAVRQEKMPRYGTTHSYKIASRYQLSPNLGIRASVGTAFRAPTPGQANSFNVTAQFDLDLMDLTNNGTVPSTNPVARLRGGDTLELEKSRQMSVGITANLGVLNVTVDYFNIRVRDRLTLSQLYTLQPDEVAGLLASGVTSAANLQNFRFFVNDFDTETDSVDLTAGLTQQGDWGVLAWSLGVSHTRTKVEHFNPASLDARNIRNMEESLPELRGHLAMDFQRNRWGFLWRLSHYGGWYDPSDALSYGGGYVLDVEGTYRLRPNTEIRVGAQNLLDDYPDKNPHARARVGNLYSEFSPLGFNGGLWYVAVNHRLGR